MKELGLISLLFFGIGLRAQFDPPAGQVGSKAIHKDSSIIVGWAKECEILRGPMDISQPDSGLAFYGEPVYGIHAADNFIVSLGDGGMATLQFAQPLFDGPGYDFAIFENAFLDTYLELAFVEVSSDGLNYVRFPATSNTQTATQIDAFGSVDATELNNLAGKYRVDYGTPFDLKELDTSSVLDVTSVTHVRIIDVVGSIDDQYASRDHLGQKINDPWPTLFPSSGFDLDAVAALNQLYTGIQSEEIGQGLKIGPNPFRDEVRIQLTSSDNVRIEIHDLKGQKVFMENHNGSDIILRPSIPSGVFVLTIFGVEEVDTMRLIKE